MAMATNNRNNGNALTEAWRWLRTNQAEGKRRRGIRKTLTIVDQDTAHSMHRAPLVYSDNRVAITNDAVWTGCRVPMRSWAFAKHSDRERAWSDATTFFGRVFPSEPTNSGHIIVTNRVFSAAAWHQNIIAKAKAANLSTAANNTLTGYLTESKRARLDGQYGDNFFERNVYLFTKIGSRTEGKSATQLLLNALSDLIAMAALDKEPPEPAEIAAWVEKAEGVTSVLNGSWLRAQPISQWEVEWLTRHLDTPSMPTPSLAYVSEDDFSDPAWVERGRLNQARRGLDPDHPERGVPATPGHKAILGESAIEAWGFGQWKTVMASHTRIEPIGRGANKEDLYAVRFDTPTADDDGNHTSYACYLPINHIPAHIFYNINWLNESSKLGFPVDASLYFQVLDQVATEKELDRKIRSAENQAMEDQEAGVSGDETNRENHATLEAVKKHTKQNKQPLVHWQCVLSVNDTDKERLQARVNALINHYKQTLQMELVCPGDDQRELFYQSLPGSEVIVEDWFQTTGPEYLASAAPWLTDSIGDNKGMYQGFTLTESGSKGMPFFYDNFSPVDEVGKAPTEVVTAEPGWGKRTCLKTVVPKAFGGFTTVGELSIGDLILDETGEPCTVTHLHPIVTDTDAYEVVFDDGTVVVADGEHRWLTETRASRLSGYRRNLYGPPKSKGRPEFVAQLEHMIQSVDPEDTVSTTDIRLMCPHGPNRDVWMKVAKSLTPAGTYCQHTRLQGGGGGRIYPLFNHVEFARAMWDWAHEGMNEQQHRRELPQVRTTKDILTSLRVGSDNRVNHSIPLAQPAQYPTADLLVDPYVLGAWLGDGSRGAGHLTGLDAEVWLRIEAAGYTVTHSSVAAKEHGIHGLQRDLRCLGVLNNKHIPDVYLTADYDQRLALLQGLMDTDGSVDEGGSCEFYQSDEPLARQVRSLVASLGMKASIRSKQGGYTDSDGTYVPCKTAWTVEFRPNAKVFHLARKLARLDLSVKRTSTERRYIVDVRPVESVPMRCITVDSPSHLYLCTDQYVATHNTVSRGLKCVFEDALQGVVTQFVWDPKGDFRPLFDARRELGLAGRVTMVDLGDPNSSVSLDAFAVAEVGEDDDGEPIDQRPTLARRVLRQLLTFSTGDNSQVVRVSELAVTRVIRGEQHGEGVASMRQVLATLRRWAENNFDGVDTSREGDELPLVRADPKQRVWVVDAATEAFQKLTELSKDKLGRLLFKPFGDGSARSMKIVPGSLTIFIAMQLKLLEEGDTEQEEHRISTVIASLMTDYIRSLLSEPSIIHSKKAAVFDEWHAIKRVNGAEGLMNWMRRMGRSRRCCIRQLSQSAGDFDVNSLTTAWCGHVDSVEEAEKSCTLLGIEQSENNIQLLMSLGKGQFLFRDHLSRVARVEVDFWDQGLLDLFNTQAVDKERREQMQAQGAHGDT